MKSILSLLEQAEQAQSTGDWQLSVETWRQLYTINPVNKDYALSIAMSLYRMNDYEQAIIYFKEAKNLSVISPSLISYNIACCYALGEHSDEAIRWLKMALDEGFSEITLAQTDSDLEILHNNPEFLHLVALASDDKWNHASGWRFDLAFMVQHIKHVSYKPFTHTTETAFDIAVNDLHEQIPDLTDTQIIIEIMKLLTEVGNGHTFLMPTDDLRVPLFKRFLPFELFWLDDHAIILSALSGYQQYVTLQLTHIDGHPLSEIRAIIEAIVSRDNEIWLDEMGTTYLTCTSLMQGLGIIENDDKVVLTLIDVDGNPHDETIEISPTEDLPMYEWHETERCFATEPSPEFLAQRHRHYWTKHIPEYNLLYLQFNQVRNMNDDENLAQFAERVQTIVQDKSIENIVVDVRWNTGGNNYLCMPLLHYLIGYDALKLGRIFTIIGRRTFSAAQNFVSLLERHTNTIFVGEPTGSSPNFIGETRTTQLPYSKLVFSVSDLFWQNSVPTDTRPYIAPHIYTPLTYDDILKGDDPAMHAIIAELNAISA